MSIKCNDKANSKRETKSKWFLNNIGIEIWLELDTWKLKNKLRGFYAFILFALPIEFVKRLLKGWFFGCFFFSVVKRCVRHTMPTIAYAIYSHLIESLEDFADELIVYFIGSGCSSVCCLNLPQNSILREYYSLHNDDNIMCQCFRNAWWRNDSLLLALSRREKKCSERKHKIWYGYLNIIWEHITNDMHRAQITVE